jgi:type I restriction enzyme S subunit
VGWFEVEFGDVLELKYGKALPARIRDGKIYAVYGSNGVVGYHSTPLVKGPALIVGRKGSIGEVHLSDDDCSPIDTTYFIDTFYNQPPLFWLHRLRCLNLGSLNRATAIPGLNRNDAYQIRLLVPPLREQFRIVEKIETLNNRNRKARKSLETIPILLDKFRRSVLASAFRGDLTADWRAQNQDVEPATKLLERIRKERRKRWEEDELAKMKAKGKSPKDDKWKKRYKEPAPVDTTDLPDLPDGWCWTTLESVSFVQGGITLGQKRKKETEYVTVPYLRVANVQRGYLDLTDIKQIEVAIERLKDLYLQDGDVLFNEGGDRDKLGRGWVWGNEIENCTHQNHVFRARLVGHMIPELLSYYSNEFGRNYFFQNATQSVNLASINKTMLSGLPVPIIPPSEQSEIYSYIQAAFAKIEQVEQVVYEAISNINKLNQSILSKAFSGALVPQDPKDEPASELLQRIKLEQKVSQKEKKAKPRRKLGTKQKESKRLKKDNERRPLIELLQQHSSGLTPEALFQEAGFDKDLVDEFYAELKDEISQGNIIEGRPDQEQVILRLKVA